VFELVAPGATTPLNDKFKNDEGFNENMLMAPDKLIDEAIKGMKNDSNEIYPGLAKVMRVLSRLIPKLLLSQTAKMYEKVAAGK
jgi:uncharacterized oxidoreductase